jgi:UDP-N-acetylmuramate--alanine ligase
MNESGSNAHSGTGEHFVVEADESDGTFLLLPTTAAIVTNVEPDHLNYWGTFAALEQAFVDFIINTSKNAGFAVVCGDDAGAKKVAVAAADLGARVITYGTHASSDAVVTMMPTDAAGSVFTVTYKGDVYGPINLVVPGEHNALNATAALVTALELGAPAGAATDGLSAFTGTHRRFEFRGEVAGVRVFDDYAHHPTEITAVLRAARTVVGAGKVLVAFQSHHFYRTALFSKEFGEALGLADFVVVLEVFAPGETPIPGASGSVMASNVPLPDDSVVFEPSWSAVPATLVQRAGAGDLIMTLGAGDIGIMCPQILELLSARGVS